MNMSDWKYELGQEYLALLEGGELGREAYRAEQIAKAEERGRIAARTVPVPESSKTRPVQRGTAQDAAILAALTGLGYDPLNLPKNPAGKPGVKAAVRAALLKDKLFTGPSVFNSAWERLTGHGDIVIRRA
jgi:hypothetical protein